MSHGTEHHLEEVEHVKHAKHDPFDRRVAMTMAIVAATLAFVVLASHRAHNETLSQQIISSKHTTEAANRWAQYQAKVVRSYQYEEQVRALPLLAKDPKKPRAEEESEALVKEMKQKVADWRHDTEGITEKAQEHMAKAKEAAGNSEHAHHQSVFFDAGELGVELALVLCSVAMLARRQAFWYAGMLIGAIGLAVAVAGFFVAASHGSAEEHEALAPRRPAVLVAQGLGDRGRGLSRRGATASACGQEGIDAQGLEQAT